MAATDLMRPEGADEPLPEDDPTKPVGIVFVHGIGSQPQTATLREFAQPLIDWLSVWHRARGLEGFGATSADLSYGGALLGPARLRLQLPAYVTPPADGQPSVTHPARTWVLAEAWWSTRLIAPEYTRMLLWS